MALDTNQGRTPRQESLGTRSSEVQPMTSLRIFILALAASLGPWSRCSAADIVYIGDGAGSRASIEAVQLAADFYGLGLNKVEAIDSDSNSAILRALRRSATVAVVISARTLPLIKRRELFKAMSRPNGRRVPILVREISPDTDVMQLKLWSAGAVVSCSGLAGLQSARVSFTSHMKGVTRELSGQAIPLPGSTVYHLCEDRRFPTEALIRITGPAGDHPVFVRALSGHQEVFLEADLPLAARVSIQRERLSMAFAHLAPLFMFVRYAAGEYGWHTVGEYANLTVDDPWLTEPYGNLSYKDLLGEMQRYNFHTTIAFIPWNFARSQPDVAMLFRRHPDRFSVCIHGNDHRPREFDRTTTTPLIEQVASLRQAITRMKRFTELTGVACDPVMSWPYERVPPVLTLGTLAEANLLASVDTSPVPLDSAMPADPLFVLSPHRFSFANIVTIKRYALQDNTLQPDVLIDAFLENPLLFFVHQDYFASGIQAFSSVARSVNQTQPNTIWQSLGYIAEQLYLLRLVDNNTYDVLAFCRRVAITNQNTADAVFRVKKPDSGIPPINDVTVDGQPYPYRLEGGYVALEVSMPAKTRRLIDIQYRCGWQPRPSDLSRPSVSSTLRRRLCDFRDMTVSRYLAGRVAIGLWELRWCFLCVAFFLSITSCYLWSLTRRRRMAKRAGVADTCKV